MLYVSHIRTEIRTIISTQELCYEGGWECVLYVCLIRVPYTCALYVPYMCLICALYVPYMCLICALSLYVCLICVPYMCALYVCLIYPAAHPAKDVLVSSIL